VISRVAWRDAAFGAIIGGMAEAAKYVTIEITFECPFGHEITRSLSRVQLRGSHRFVEERAFAALNCTRCAWSGTKYGREAKRINVSEWLGG